jgi:hypothetical protein
MQQRERLEFYLLRFLDKLTEMQLQLHAHPDDLEQLGGKA